MKNPKVALLESNTTGTGALFVSAAKALGVEPILLADNPGRYPFANDQSLNIIRVNTQSTSEVRDVCRDLYHDGLIGLTSSSDYFIHRAAQVSDELGLPTESPDVISRLQDKGRQRSILEEDGVPVPEYFVIQDPSSARDSLLELGKPSVLKPISGSGSVGVRLCSSAEEAGTWAEHLLLKSTNERGIPVARRLVVEEYVSGPEYSVEMFDGVCVVITEKHMGPEPNFVEVGHDIPAMITQHEKTLISRCAEQALDALGICWGPSHVEIRLAESGPVVIEVNARLAGGWIPWLARLATGVDMVLATVGKAIDVPVETTPKKLHAASIRFIIPKKEGVVTGVSGIHEAQAVPGVIDAHCKISPADQVSLENSFRDRVGHVIAAGDSATDVRNSVEKARDHVVVDITEHSGDLREG